MSDLFSWTFIFNGLEIGVLIAVYLVVQQHRLTRPHATRLMSRAAVLWMIGVVVGMAVSMLDRTEGIRLAFRGDIEWITLFSDVAIWMYLAGQIVTSACYACSLWHNGYAALARPDERAASS
jgi:hypothetical protein